MQRLIFNQMTPSKEMTALPFALTDIFTEYVHSNHIEIIHFWQLEKTFILGMKDTRTPFFKKGVQEILNTPYFPIVRNSGGLGVIADAGILNITYLFPKTSQTASTDQAYEKMFQLTQDAFPELTIDAYEIVDSYCPGTYDLSVNGQKIAGIAQRRIKEGIAVMMYLSVNGDQAARGQLVRHFYDQSLDATKKEAGYPTVNPASMVTLETLLGQPLSIHAVKQRFEQLFEPTHTSTSPVAWVKSQQLVEKLEQKAAGMQKRNQVIQEVQNEFTLQTTNFTD
ncbi:lipoate--protein ligase family protein [Enterococcus sp. LJL98]